MTGKHPEIEEVRARAAAETLHPMPDVDLARPRTFIEFTLEGKPIGPFNTSAAHSPSPFLSSAHLTPTASHTIRGHERKHPTKFNGRQKHLRCLVETIE